MGQRTAILIKRNFKNGKTDTRLIHYQWGFGKTMVAHFMEELLKSEYNYDSYYDNKTLKDYFKFDTRKCNLYKKFTRNIDVWDIKTVQELFRTTDNNNGGMIIEVTEDKDKSYFSIKEVKIGFVLGYEELDDEEIAFSRFVSANEYMYKTGGEEYCPTRFRRSFQDFCISLGIDEQVPSMVESI